MEPLFSLHHIEDSGQDWEAIQKQYFITWANSHLSQHGKFLETLSDFADGVLLINLLEVLTGGKVGRYAAKPRFMQQKIDNHLVALHYIQNEIGLKVVGCSPQDLANGNLKQIMGLIFLLSQKFSSTMRAASVATSGGSSPRAASSSAPEGPLEPVPAPPAVDTVDKAPSSLHNTLQPPHSSLAQSVPSVVYTADNPAAVPSAAAPVSPHVDTPTAATASATPPQRDSWNEWKTGTMTAHHTAVPRLSIGPQRDPSTKRLTTTASTSTSPRPQPTPTHAEPAPKKEVSSEVSANDTAPTTPPAVVPECSTNEGTKVAVAQRAVRRWISVKKLRTLASQKEEYLRHVAEVAAANPKAVWAVVKLQARFRGAKQRKLYRQKVSRRTDIAKEILSTEQTYVARLATLVRVFLEPMRGLPEGVVDQNMIRTVCSQIEVILNYNRHMLSKLEARMKAWYTSGQRLGDIFLEMVAFLKAYTTYVNNYNSAFEAVLQARKNQKFEQFLDKAHTRPECGGLPIDSYLILPIQRIPRYVLLLEDLFKHTPPTHPDYPQLSKALKQMRDVAEYVNEKKREAENLHEVMKISQQLTGRFEPLPLPHRRYVRRGPLLELFCSPNESYSAAAATGMAMLLGTNAGNLGANSTASANTSSSSDDVRPAAVVLVDTCPPTDGPASAMHSGGMLMIAPPTAKNDVLFFILFNDILVRSRPNTSAKKWKRSLNRMSAARAAADLSMSDSELGGNAAAGMSPMSTRRSGRVGTDPMAASNTGRPASGGGVAMSTGASAADDPYDGMTFKYHGTVRLEPTMVLRDFAPDSEISQKYPNLFQIVNVAPIAASLAWPTAMSTSTASYGAAFPSNSSSDNSNSNNNNNNSNHNTSGNNATGGSSSGETAEVPSSAATCTWIEDVLWRRGSAEAPVVTLASLNEDDKMTWMSDLDDTLNALLEKHRTRHTAAPKPSGVDGVATTPPVGTSPASTGSTTPPPAKATPPLTHPTRSGLLWKLDKGNQIWKKRYFVLQDDTLYYFKLTEGAAALSPVPSGVIAVAAHGCGVRLKPVMSRPFCFQITTPMRVLFLSAETSVDMFAWVAALRVTIMVHEGILSPAASGLSTSATSATSAAASGSAANGTIAGKAAQDIINELLTLSENKVCADCGQPGPTFAVVSIGCFVCTECSGIHRRCANVGGGVIKVKALNFGRWDADDVEHMRRMGNSKVNSVYEKNVPSFMAKPSPKESHAVKVKYIQTKYGYAVSTPTPSVIPPAVGGGIAGTPLSGEGEISSDIEKSGFLKRQRSNPRKQWRRNWFTLKDGSLKYFKSSGRQSMKRGGTIDMLVASVKQSSVRKTVLEITTPTRIYLLEADTEQEANEWVRTLSAATQRVITSEIAASATRSNTMPASTMEPAMAFAGN